MTQVHVCDGEYDYSSSKIHSTPSFFSKGFSNTVVDIFMTIAIASENLIQNTNKNAGQEIKQDYQDHISHHQPVKRLFHNTQRDSYRVRRRWCK